MKPKLSNPFASVSTKLAICLTALQFAHGASTSWVASPTDANWATGSNWASGTAPGTAAGGYGNASRNGDVATFNQAVGTFGSVSNPILIDANRFIKGITFDTASAGSYYIGTTGGSLLQVDQGGSIVMNSTVTASQVINAPLQVRAQSSFNPTYTLTNNAANSAATLSIGGTIATNSSTGRGVNWVLNGTNTGINTISGVMSGGGSGGFTPLTKNGAGTWKLTAANTLGSVVINEGILIAGNTNALGTGVTTVNGGTLSVENVALANSSVILNSGGTVQGTGAGASVKVVNVGATATSVGLSTATGSDVLAVGVAANGLTGGQASSVVNISGPGTVSLGYASNYAGGFSINSGTLKLGSATALGSASSANVGFGAGSTGTLAINGQAATLSALNSNLSVGTPVIENNSATAGTLTVSNTSGASVYAGVIRDGAAGGALSLVKDGASTLTLSGASTFTGGITLSGGTLTASSAGALGTGAISVASGSTLATDTNANLGNLSLAGGANILLADYNSSFISSGTIGISGSGNTLMLSGSAATAGSTYTLLLGSSLSASGISLTGTGVSGLTVALGSNATIGRTTYDFSASATALELAVTGGAFNLSWNGGNANWNDADANWQKDGAGSNIAFFAGDNITISTGDSIVVDAGGVTAGPVLFNNASGTAALSGGLLATTNLGKSGAGSVTLDNNVSVTNVDVQAGSMALNAANTVTDSIAISGGTLVLGANDAAGAGTATLAVSGGQLDLGASNQSLSNVSLTSGSITGTTGVLTATGNNIDVRSGTASAILGGGVGLDKSTAGTVVLTGANTYTGATTISAGTLQIGNGGTTGSIANTSGVANNGTLDYNRSDALTVGYAISGAGELVKDGAGTLTLTSTNIYAGATTINGGTLQIGNGGTTGSIANTSGVINEGALVYNRSDALTVGYAISGSGSVVKDGANTLTLSNARTYSGGTTVNAGTLALGEYRAAGTGTITAVNGTTIAALSGVGGNAVGNAITLSGTNANVTLTNNNLSGGINSAITGSADQTVTISNAGGTVVNMNSGGKQLQSFLGTVSIATGQSLAFRATSLNNGGDNALFEVNGSLSTRNGGNIAIGALSGSGTVSMGASGSNNTWLTYTIGARNTNAEFSGVIQDAETVNGKRVAIVKTGSAIQTLSGVNTYTGTTAVNQGTLEVFGSGDINSTSGVTVASGSTFRYNSSVAYSGGAITNNGGTITGTGTIAVAVNLDTIADVLAPGNSPGIQTYNASQSWNGFTYQWETNNFTGTTAGTDFDQIGIIGTLTLGGTSYGLDLISLLASNAAGDVPNFFDANRSWTILTTTGGISGFDAGNWTIDSGAFTSSPSWTGTWNLAQSSNDLVLSYTVIPEPNAAMLVGGLGMLSLLRRRRNG